MSALEAYKQEAPPPGPETVVTLPDRGWRRWWQVAVAAAGLVGLLPVSLVIAAVIKLTSRGPVLYRGTRIGRELRPFTIYKFRTLLTDAEQRIGARLLRPGDTVYTPIGRFLKRYKLDEIPQLWNVVRGDMNMVGPRPIRPIFLATALRDIPNYRARFAVRPGMTGLAQLRGGYFTDPRDKLRYDVIYTRHRGVWLDLKLVVATFVKLINRWLTLGLLLGLTFLCASFAPGVFRAPFEITVGGFQLSPVEALGLVVAGIVLIRQVPSHRLYLYRTPTNWPMACFVVFSLVAGLVAGDMAPRLRDLAYFTASGFMLYFLMVSGEITDGFAIRATRVVALAAVAVALLGIFEVALQTRAEASPEVLARLGGHIGITATLGNPVVLATYLVLGMPLVLVELASARRREERDFWLISTTLVVVCVLLTQTRTGLLALAVTGSVFCWRASRRVFVVVAGATAAFVAIMIVIGGLGLSPAQLGEQWSRRASVTEAVLTAEPTVLGVLVGPEPGKGATSVIDVDDQGIPRQEKNANMHLTLLERTGVIGWALMMWVIGAALVAIKRGSRAVQDPRLSWVLWAIFSSGLGFLVSMSGFNAFYYPSIQVLFWGLLGIGMALVTHRTARRPAFNVIWRFGAGE